MSEADKDGRAAQIIADRRVAPRIRPAERLTSRPVTTTNDAELAANVRAAAARAGVRQAQVADVLGLDKRAVSRRFAGDVPFTALQLDRVAGLCDVELAALIRPGNIR